MGKVNWTFAIFWPLAIVFCVWFWSLVITWAVGL